MQLDKLLIAPIYSRTLRILLRTFKWLLILLLYGKALSVGHCQDVYRINFTQLEMELRSSITNKSTSEENLLMAISHLGPVTESPEFWTRIANDSTYSLEHRRRAIMALFRRHCWATTVKALGDKLSPAQWLREADISSYERVSPENEPMPTFEVNSRDSIFVIKPFQGRIPSQSIYIRVAGKMPLEEFSRLIRKDRVELLNLTSDGLILECAIGDDFEKWLHSKKVS